MFHLLTVYWWSLSSHYQQGHRISVTRDKYYSNIWFHKNHHPGSSGTFMISLDTCSALSRRDFISPRLGNESWNYTWKLKFFTWAHKCSVVQPCPTLCDPVDCSPPGRCVHGIVQARILEWVVISFSRGSSQTVIVKTRACNEMQMTTTAFSILKLFNPIKVIIDVYGHSISEVFLLEIFFDVDLWKNLCCFCYNTASVLCFGFLAVRHVWFWVLMQVVEPAPLALELKS